jgi:hypothetical protein
MTLKKRPCKKCGIGTYGKLCRGCYCVRVAKKKLRHMKKNTGISTEKPKQKYKFQHIEQNKYVVMQAREV